MLLNVAKKVFHKRSKVDGAPNNNTTFTVFRLLADEILGIVKFPIDAHIT